MGIQQMLLAGSAPVTPLLDLYGSAAVAYSTRKVRSAYAGSCLRVRTSAVGNAETDIGFDANGNLDEVALTAAIGANNGTVVTWYDQSGNGINVTQATAANQPQLVSAGTILKNNGRVTLLGNGSSQSLMSAASITGVSSSRQVSLSAVHKSSVTSGTGNGIAVLQRASGYDFQSGMVFERRGTNLSFTEGSGTTGAFATTAFQIWQVANSNITAAMTAQVFIDGIAGTHSMYLDGASQTLSSVSGTLATSNFISTGSGNHRIMLFARIDNTNTVASWWQGSISEVIVWPSNQTANQAGIKANQASHFGTP